MNIKIMNYEEKYKMALETVQEILSSGADAIRIKRLKLRLQSVFPELKESEDERIKREILELVSSAGNGNQFEEISNWLENQGKNVQPDIPEDGQILNSLNDVDKRVFLDRPVTLRAAIAWLEKQGEQHSPIDINKMVNEFAHTEVKGYGIPNMIEVDAYRKGINDAVKEAGDQHIVDFDSYKKVVYGLSSAFMDYLDNIRPEGKMCLSNMECADIEKAFLEMDWAKLYRYIKDYSKEGSGIEGDEEPDEVMQKQKFNVGDWIANKSGLPYKVKSVFWIDGGYYIATNLDGEDCRICFGAANEDFHLWTTQDAKDGDILSFETEDCEWFLIFKDIIPASSVVPHDSLRYHALLSGDVLSDNGICAMVSDDYDYYIHPAIKEQRDMLFNKMREVGAKWDSEKKQLKYIEL